MYYFFIYFLFSYAIMKNEKHILSNKMTIGPSALKHLTVLICNNSLTLSDSLLPMSLKTLALSIDVLSEPMLSIVLVISLKRRTVFPSEEPLTVKLTLLEKSRVFSLWNRQKTLAIKFIVFKRSLIKTTVWKFILSFTVFLSVQEIPFIRSTIAPYFLAFPIRHIVEPTTHISIFLEVIYEDAFPLSYVMPYLALIKSTSLENKAALSLCIAVAKSAIVIRTVRHVKFTKPMRLLIFPLSCVYDVFLVNQVWTFGLASFFQQGLVSDFVLTKTFRSLFNVSSQFRFVLNGSIFLTIDFLGSTCCGHFGVEDHILVRIWGAACGLAHLQNLLKVLKNN